MSTNPFPIVLSFAATDPSGGAGCRQISSSPVWVAIPCRFVTGITVQDSAGVDDLLPMEADWVVDQARMILEDMPVAAFKIGLIGEGTDNVAAIAEIVADYPDIPLVLDPVLASGAGDEFATEELIAADA